MIFPQENIAFAASAALLAGATIGEAATIPVYGSEATSHGACSETAERLDPLARTIALLDLKLSQMNTLLLSHASSEPLPRFPAHSKLQYGVPVGDQGSLTFVKRGEEEMTAEEKERMKNVTDRSKDRTQRMNDKEKEKEGGQDGPDMSNVTGRSKDRTDRMEKNKQQQ